MNKLRNNKGESLSEALVAGLVIALALIILSTMVTASQKLIRNSIDAFKENIQEKNAAEYGGSDGTDGTVSLPTSGGTLQISGGSLLDSDSSFTWSGSLKDIRVTVQKDTDNKNSVQYTE